MAETTKKPLTLQQKFIKLREAIPAIEQKKHSDGVKYKFAKIFDVYKLLTPAMNEYGVNFEPIAEKATRHAENGDDLYYHSYTQNTKNGSRTVWVYEADLTCLWTNADDPNDTLEVTLHAIGTNDGGPDKAKGSAWTYCLKYYLFEKFGIDQGEDDPDNFDHGSDAPPQPQNKGYNTSKGSKGYNNSTQRQNAQNGQTGASKKLSEAQLKRMYSKGEAAGFTKEKVDQRIAKKYELQDPRDMTREQYDETCKALDEAGKDQGGTPNA